MVSKYAATMPPVPKKADCPNESRPVNPKRMSKPMPNTPQTRMRLIVVGVNPKYGRMNGATISPAAVRTSMRKGRCLSIRCLHSFAAGRAEQPVGTQHEHQRHGHEKHDVGVAWVEHRGEADDLACDKTAEQRARERAHAADDDHDERLYQDRFADVGRDRNYRRVDDAGEARRHGAD